MKKFILFFSVCFTLKVALAQTGNVGIGTGSPDASSMLDIQAADRGILIPNVALTATNTAGPVSSPANSLLVYNTATAGIAPNNVSPGYYYWDGTKWVRLINSKTLNANNGLSVANDTLIQLGGVLIQPTTVSGLSATNKMSFTGSGVDAFNVAGTTFSVDASNNRVGVGTAVPANTLNVNNSGTTMNSVSTYPFGIQRSGSTDFTFGSDGSYALLQSWNSKPLLINSQGNNVGIGLTSTPQEKLHVAGNIRSNNLAGTGNRPVSADANGTLIIGNGKIREVTIHDCYVGAYLSCSGCDKFVWFPRPGGSSGDDEDDNPLYEKNMWIAPYDGRIVAIYLAVDPTSSNSGEEISKGRFVFEHADVLPENTVSYYTTMSNSGSSSYTNSSNWNGGSFTTIYGTPSYTLSSPNRGRFNMNETEKIRWDSNGSTLFSFTKGQTLAIGISGEYVEDNSYHMTVIWEYDVDDY